MNLSQEKILALKISLWLLIFGFIFVWLFQYFNQSSISDYWKLHNWQNKYIILFLLSLITYFLSLYLAKITIRPLKKVNTKLKEYNHNLAHEIKTPLSIIKSNLELLEISFDKELITSSKEEIIEMQNIIDSLLFLSENNELKNKTKIIVNDIINNYYNDNILIKSNSEFKLEWNLYLIDRLIKNLIENATKYWQEWEKIEVEIRESYISISNKIDKALNINNTDKLFDTFYQADNSRSGSWYWLGLSIVKKIIDLHWLRISISIKNNIFSVIIKK